MTPYQAYLAAKRAAKKFGRASKEYQAAIQVWRDVVLGKMK